VIIPKSNPLVVAVPKSTNFHIPEGKYLAKVSSVRKLLVEKANCTGEMLKLMFDVSVPSLPKTINLAKAEFKLDLNPGSELHNLCIRLCGKQTMDEASGGNFNLATLENKPVEIEIEHVITNRRDEYQYPLVKVRNIQLAQPEAAK